MISAPLARNSDPITSHAAADEAKALRHEHQALILDCLKHQGPAGKDAIARRTGLTGVQVCRRLPELAHAFLIRETGANVRSDSGRAEREWEVVA